MREGRGKEGEGREEKRGEERRVEEERWEREGVRPLRRKKKNSAPMVKITDYG